MPLPPFAYYWRRRRARQSGMHEMLQTRLSWHSENLHDPEERCKCSRKCNRGMSSRLADTNSLWARSRWSHPRTMLRRRDAGARRRGSSSACLRLQKEGTTSDVRHLGRKKACVRCDDQAAGTLMAVHQRRETDFPGRVCKHRRRSFGDSEIDLPDVMPGRQSENDRGLGHPGCCTTFYLPL